MEKISFIIPCYRSEHTLPAVVDEIRTTMAGMSDRYTFDIFLVNDCSPDGTAQTIKKLCEEDDRISGISFARNFGQHAALMAGFRYSDGDICVALDDDGQTPADQVDRLLDKLEEGYDVVYTGKGTFDFNGRNVALIENYNWPAFKANENQKLTVDDISTATTQAEGTVTLKYSTNLEEK